ncbi:unnamed protein product, partial [Meganyctiphanes norvegica]
MLITSTKIYNWDEKSDSEMIYVYFQVRDVPVKRFLQNCDRWPQFLSTNPNRSKTPHYSLRDYSRKIKQNKKTLISTLFSPTPENKHYTRCHHHQCNAIMEINPKTFFVTCVYLACKIEEFYVTINDFVHNLRGDKHKAAEIILNNELQLTCELQFHLIVHQPYRPVEGLLIDIKIFFLKITVSKRRDTYVTEILITFYSQIALAAVTTAVSRVNEKMDEYVTDILFQNDQKQLMVLIEAVKKIKRMVKNVEGAPPDPLRKEIDTKLEICRNQQNNPSSPHYRTNYTDFDDDPEIPQAPPEEGGDTLGVQRIRSPSTY